MTAGRQIAMETKHCEHCGTKLTEDACPDCDEIYQATMKRMKAEHRAEMAKALRNVFNPCKVEWKFVGDTVKCPSCRHGLKVHEDGSGNYTCFECCFEWSDDE